MNEVTSIKDFLPMINLIIGGVLAIAGGFVSNWFFERWRDKRVRKALVLAFRGEISALLNIVERRGYIRRLQDVIFGMKESGEVQKFFLLPKETTSLYLKPMQKASDCFHRLCRRMWHVFTLMQNQF